MLEENNKVINEYNNSIFSWFVNESKLNGFDYNRDYSFTTKRTIFKFYNLNLKFRYYLSFTDNTFLLIYSDNSGLPNSIRHKIVYEVTDDNKDEISLLLKNFKNNEIPYSEDGIQKTFRNYYNLIKEKYYNRKDRIEGFYISFISSDNKLSSHSEYDFYLHEENFDSSDTNLTDNDSVQSCYEFKYYSDFCKYDVGIYFKSFTINDIRNDFFELYYLCKHLKKYLNSMQRIEKYLSINSNIKIPNDYPILLDEIGLDNEVLTRLKYDYNIKTIKGFLALSEDNINSLSYVQQTDKETIIQKQKELTIKYDTIFFDLITEDIEKKYLEKNYEKSIWSLQCSRKILLALIRNNIFSADQLKKLNDDDIKKLRGVNPSIINEIISIKKRLTNE